MHCNQMSEHFIDVASGVAPTSQEKSHLRECLQCAAHLKELHEIFVLLDEWKAPEPSFDFDKNLKARLSSAEERPKVRRHVRATSR